MNSTDESMPTTQSGITFDQLRQRPTLSVPEAGAVLGLGRAASYAAAKSGEIKTVRIGSRLIVPTQWLLRTLDAEV